MLLMRCSGLPLYLVKFISSYLWQGTIVRKFLIKIILRNLPCSTSFIWCKSLFLLIRKLVIYWLRMIEFHLLRVSIIIRVFFYDKIILIVYVRDFRTSFRRRKLDVLRLGSLVDVVLKIAFFYVAVWKGHDTIAMLNSFLPITFVNAAIGPCHFSVTMAFIFKIVTGIMVA